MKPHFRNYPINHKFQEKNCGYYCWKLKKRKVIHYKFFTIYSSQLARALSTIRAGRARAVRGNTYEETDKGLHISGNAGRVPHLINPSEETIYESNKIKEQNETMELQNEEVMLRNT